MNCAKCRYFDENNYCHRYPPGISGWTALSPSDWCGEFKSATVAKRAASFVPPTVEQVKAYCIERNNEIDAQQFVDFYRARGWKLSSGQMKDWQAAVRTWEARWEQRKAEGRVQEKAPLAASHKPFASAPGQSAEDKARAAAELARLQGLVEARRKS